MRSLASILILASDAAGLETRGLLFGTTVEDPALESRGVVRDTIEERVQARLPTPPPSPPPEQFGGGAGDYDKLCSGATNMDYSGAGYISAVDVAQIWMEVSGQQDSCASAVAIVYGESCYQDGPNQGDGCAGGIDGACCDPQAVAGGTTFGLFQVTDSIGPENQWDNWPTVEGCDAQYSTPAAGVQLQNPCCNSYVALKITEAVCVPGGGGGTMNNGVDPFCSSQWTGGVNYYANNLENAQAACTAALDRMASR